jgi:2-C-methyl-D-erythritol 4-phosphate cytidylyltransferase
VSLGGRTLIEWAVTALAPHVDEIVVAVSDDQEARCRRLLPDVMVLIGGSSRQQTVTRLLAATDARWVMVHDAARPFLPERVAGEVMAAARRHGASTAAQPVADTLYHAAEERTVDRRELHAIQTPQAFEREVLLRAHRQAVEAGLTATDDAELVRHSGHPVALVRGSPWLNKITLEGDFELAAALVSSWRNRAS